MAPCARTRTRARAQMYQRPVAVSIGATGPPPGAARRGGGALAPYLPPSFRVRAFLTWRATAAGSDIGAGGRCDISSAIST